MFGVWVVVRGGGAFIPGRLCTLVAGIPFLVWFTLRLLYLRFLRPGWGRRERYRRVLPWGVRG